MPEYTQPAPIFGRYALHPGVRVATITGTGAFSSAWVPLFSLAPWTLTVVGIFTGSVDILVSNQAEAPTLADGAYPTVQASFTTRGQFSSNNPYGWVKAAGSMSVLTTSVFVDLRAVAGVEARG